ncbi:histone-fold-containing protein [Microdochium trichocladiopsis]|uniref:Histone-fold-containing protein n=1 Tax=Microdochium trichocladiopsis TaxID=1682393 RepID=A0A9P9BNI5_9PEZI|nr:histone-fold-containing protein [Microdochium trichocladiopsis]KAH7031291.1 histone-fold-containing protein [Microdochium trichocladiopsis]
MPYNTTAIPPRQEVTGQAQLPLSRVKKIIAQDQDINMCSNNAAFVITLATEMFVQYLAEEGLNMAKLDRKPRKNIQYKDIANAVSHKDNLEFLSDMVPKTVPYKQIKSQAAATRAKLNGEGSASASAVASPSGAGAEDEPQATSAPTSGNGSSHKKHKAGKRSSNIGPNVAELLSGGVPGARPPPSHDEQDGPDDQLRSEAMRGRDDDVSMSG